MISFVDFIFLNLAFVMIVVGALMNFIESYLPLFIKQNFRYGKYAYSGSSKSSLKLMDLPKSYFRHFYVGATILSVVCLITSIYVYFAGYMVPSWIISFIDLWCGSNRTPILTPGATLLSLSLLTVQCFRRFYETFFLQVFANSSKINFSHYLVGHFHYFGCNIVILGSSVGFSGSQDISDVPFFDVYTTLMILPALSLFFVAWVHQLQSNKILANLRKDKNSQEVISQKYFLPKGGWFQYVSSPHILCEILIYISLTFLLVKSFSWLCILAWVVSNQIETALLSHAWYFKTFPNYPKHRKAVIPYLL